MSFQKQLFVQEVWKCICDKCGVEITIHNLEKDQKYLDEHEKVCNCKHCFSEWITINVGTWPEGEYITSRQCSICKQKEYL